MPGSWGVILRRAGRGAAWTAASGALVVAVVLSAGGCFTPPVLLETKRQPLVPADFPPQAELLELLVEPEVALRGVFVPARGAARGPAPVVLDFLESSGSLTGGARSSATRVSFELGSDDEPLLGELRAESAPPETAEYLDPSRRRLALLPLLGFSVLCLDYTGVGASDGERSADNLRRDAHAAWDEAVRRAGGDPSRVVLRGTSIGALPVAALLQDGARPGAVILVAPVRDETVASNGARALEGAFVAFLVGWTLRAPVGADLAEELRRARPPLLVVVPERDDFLRHDERLELRRCVDEVGGTWLVRGAEHVALSLAARDLLAAEAWFLAQSPLLPAPAERQAVALDAWGATAAAAEADAFAPGSPARARLEQLLTELPSTWPALAPAFALADDTPAERRELLDVLAWLPDAALARLDAASLARFADLDDPAGRLDTGNTLRWLTGRVPDLAGCTADQILERLAATTGAPAGPAVGSGFSVSLVTGEYEEWRAGAAAELASCVGLTLEALQKQGLSERDAQRHVLRLVLKAAGVPERVMVGDDSVAHVQVAEDGAWRTVTVPGWIP
jgi:Serine aminopeptidase, S33